jgi:hypothetical protein
MSVEVDRQGVAPETRRRSTWVDVAERLDSIDRRTAERLAFCRWLREAGRLSDGDVDVDREDPLPRPRTGFGGYWRRLTSTWR